MASSDDEEETLPDVVSDYYFCGAENEPLLFTELPVQWSENESSDGSGSQIFLRGTADNGLQKLHKPVKAWKCDFSKEKPEISVLSKDNNWIKLQKPRKSYENEIRTILITLHCLHFCKKKPEASGKSLWDHLSKVFSRYDGRPSENDLIDHLNFISEAVKRDQTLAKSKFLATFLKEKPRKRKSLDEDAEAATKASFIVDDVTDEYGDDDFARKDTEDSESDDEDDVFDSVCAICDNGGDLTCCEGKCLRSFHATVESAVMADSNCDSLGLPAEAVEGTTPFFCENCRHNQHQCFICGRLGSSDKSSNPEVFCCSSATCGRFYHPKCVAELIHPGDEDETHDLAHNLQVMIAAGEPFTCPSHKCHLCKKAENETVRDLQFAMCRRCPRSYHRKCLPRKIVFYNEDNNDEVVARAWDNLLPKSRALIYCLKHKIDEELGTPARNLKFPKFGQSEKRPSELLVSREKVKVKEKDLNSEHTSEKRSAPKLQKSVGNSTSAVKLAESSRKRVPISSVPESMKKPRLADSSKRPLKRTPKVNRSTSFDGSQPSLGSQLYDLLAKNNEQHDFEKDYTSVDEEEPSPVATPRGMKESSLPPIDDDSKQRILALMKDAASSITLDVVKKHHRGKLPSTHANSSDVGKSIILARVEGSVEAVQLALRKLEEGCSIEDAKAVCEPGILDQIIRWKEKLKVYLAPFLHGMRYTSFGRHFTKVDKLEKIVDRLRWYVEDGDTIVDFCCGANDFSCLLKKRLDEMGKSCSFKNYDISRPKNDFNYEKRDWMTVEPNELPSGSRLIMGLNPPFGKNAHLANQFIRKALRFKPKLVILIVPPETERLDRGNKKTRYDLVWEDASLLAGKSFYLPGSVDINDKQMEQWNLTPPPLYLWSRSDWTSKHNAIAQQHGHIPGAQGRPFSPENVRVLDLPAKTHDRNDEAAMLIDDFPVMIDGAEAKASKSQKDASGGSGGGSEGKKLADGGKRSNKKHKKKNRGSVQPLRDELTKNRSPPLPLQPRSSETPHSDAWEGRGEKPSPPPPRHESPRSDAAQPFDQPVYESYPHHEARYGGTREEDVASRYHFAARDPYVPAVYGRPDGGSLAAPDYRFRRPDPIQFPRENADGRYTRASYIDEMAKYGLDSSLGRRTGYHEPGYGPGVSTSAMQRYAPRLDELNHTRMGGIGPGPDPNRGGGGYDLHVPGPGPGPRPAFPDASGFAPGPYRPFHQHNSSSGWLNE